MILWWRFLRFPGTRTRNAQTQLPMLAEALRKSAHTPIPRRSLMRVWATVRSCDPKLVGAATLLLQESQLDCKAIVQWTEALVAVSGRMTSETEMIWNMLADKTLLLLREHASRSWSLPFRVDHQSHLEDVAAIMSTFAVAAPEAEFSRRVSSAAAFAASQLSRACGGVHRNDLESWRRLAWACAVVGDAHTDVFGFPEVTANSRISDVVWSALSQQDLVDKTRFLTREPFPLLYFQNWLSNDVARALIEIADKGGFWEPSPLAAPGSPAGSRTSSSAVLAASRLSKADATTVLQIQRGVADLFGLPSSHMEPPQLVKYNPGEHYATHVDWGRREDATLWLSGQRVASALVYLTDHPGGGGGGETCFPFLDICVQPARGSALLWPNVSMDGIPLQETEHEARSLKVASTSDLSESQPKVAMNLWARERPQPGPW